MRKGEKASIKRRDSGRRGEKARSGECTLFCGKGATGIGEELLTPMIKTGLEERRI